MTRVRQAARERRDDEVDELAKKHKKQLDRLEKKMRKLERDLVDDKAEYETRKREEMIGAGESVLSFFIGRRRTRDATTIARRRRLTSKAKREIEETREEISEIKDDIKSLEKELKQATDEITSRWDEALEKIVSENLKPRRTDITVKMAALTWIPIWQISYSDGKILRKEIVPTYNSNMPNEPDQETT